MQKKRILVILLSIMLISCTFFIAGCDVTGEKVLIEKETGLAFKLNETKDAYILTGIGNCTDTEIIIPSVYRNLPVTSIGKRAFYDCSSLTSIEIPSSVTSIGDYAFAWNSALKLIEIPDSLTSISEGTFFNCKSLASIIIPRSVTAINSKAFSYCEVLTGIEMLGDVTSIGEEAFSYCRSLRSVMIPDSVINMGGDAFLSCDSLTISCEIDSKPSGWDSSWNCSNCPVIWGK